MQRLNTERLMINKINKIRIIEIKNHMHPASETSSVGDHL